MYITDTSLMRTLLSQPRRTVHKSTSELGTPSIQDSQLGPNGVCYTERLQCTWPPFSVTVSVTVGVCCTVELPTKF